MSPAVGHATDSSYFQEISSCRRCGKRVALTRNVRKRFNAPDLCADCTEMTVGMFDPQFFGGSSSWEQIFAAIDDFRNTGLSWGDNR